MTDTAELQRRIATLDAAIASGTLKVSIKSGDGEREVIYRSMSDLMNAKALLERQLNPQRPRASLAVFTRGA